LAQQKPDKDKLYSLHAPEVECISKGKAHKRYEFGVKASIATTNKSNFVVGGMALPGNPFDGHTLTQALEQVRRMTGVYLGHLNNAYRAQPRARPALPTFYILSKSISHLIRGGFLFPQLLIKPDDM
jgi:hypothetical protein